jgi:hypothetical protein
VEVVETVFDDSKVEVHVVVLNGFSVDAVNVIGAGSPFAVGKSTVVVIVAVASVCDNAVGWL